MVLFDNGIVSPTKSKIKRRHKMSTQDKTGVAVDIGTMNIIAARYDDAGKNIITARIRDAFLDLPLDNKRMLRLSNTSYVEMDGKLLVIGDEALATANLFHREARRPIAGGILAAGELDAQRVISIMIKQLLGNPQKDNEKCCFSVPAPALDVAGSDTTYHIAILKKLLTELGYIAEPVNEAQAIIYSECLKENFSGLGISFGAGMTNVCLAYNAMSALEFSIGRGGDWVDAGAARAVNTTAAKICAIKESGADIVNPKPESREEEAIALYIQTLIDYTLNSIIKHFSKVRNEILVPKPIPIIVSGGTSLAKGFLEKFKIQFEQFQDKFPIKISEIRAAVDPITSVASGLLIYAKLD
jgi:hypothetical protein